jgi:hypothetical protein
MSENIQTSSIDENVEKYRNLSINENVGRMKKIGTSSIEENVGDNK